MGFNLAEAAGFAGMMSNLDTREIEMIPVRLIDANENNFFTVEDVQDLKESIEVNGILQPLNVVKAGSRYRIIAGHRRFKAAKELELEKVPAIVLPEMSEAMEQLALIQTNTTARELSYPEKMEAAKQLKKILLQLKEEGVELPGKLRDIMAEQLEISAAELARMNVIEKNLISEGKQLLKEGKMSASAAYAMAQTPPDVQKKYINRLPSGKQLKISRVELIQMRVIEKNLLSEWKEELKDGAISTRCAYELAKLSVEDQQDLLEKYRAGEYPCMNSIVVMEYCEGKKRVDRKGSWHLYAEEKPHLNQRVVVRRDVGGQIQCGEYIYRDGRWFHSSLDDFEMHLTGVTHWIECPE